MSCCGTPPTLDELDEVSRLVSAKLAAFLRTLRDNAFAVGLREGQDAAALMASGYAQKPGLLRSAFKHLFSARKADWEKFDGLFDAFWLGKRVRSRSAVTGSAAPQNNPSVKSLQDPAAQAGGQAAPDQIPAGDDPGADDRSGEGRMEGASRAENLAETDFRKIADPAQMEEAHAVAARLAKDHAHETHPPRPRPPPRLQARSAPYHPPQHQPWRRADQPGEAAAQGQAAAGWSCCSTRRAR